MLRQLLLLSALLLASCATLTGTPPTAAKPSTAHQSPAAAPLPAVRLCDRYIPPRPRRVPDVPVFSPTEQISIDALNVRLVGYITELRTYLAEITRDQQQALRRYQASCGDK